jgi:hypothetical protein
MPPRFWNALASRLAPFRRELAFGAALGITGFVSCFSLLLKYEKGQEVLWWLPPCVFLSFIVMSWSLALLDLIRLNRGPPAKSRWGLGFARFQACFQTFSFLILVLVTLATPILIVKAYAAPPADQAQPPGAGCTYDQTNQLDKLKSIAATKANSRLIPQRRQVSWIEKDQTEWSLTYGGCAHLGFSVAARRKQALPMKQDEVLRAAVRMATVHWDSQDADALSTAIAAGKFERRTERKVTLYAIAREDYDAFEVEYHFAKGMEQIRIRWLRTF